MSNNYLKKINKALDEKKCLLIKLNIKTQIIYEKNTVNFSINNKCISVVKAYS